MKAKKKANNEIWVDVYEIVNLLQKNRSAVIKNTELNDYFRVYDIKDPSVPQFLDINPDSVTPSPFP